MIIRNIFFSIIFLMSIQILPQTATAPSGSGTSGDPYLIASLENLYWISQNTTTWTSGHYFEQTADIDASETSTWDDGDGGSPEGWTPIGTSSNKFMGTYDGKGYTIDSLYINRSGLASALFNYIDGGTIKNLGTTNVNITGSYRVAAIAGEISNSTITNCFSTGIIFGSNNNVGGVVGVSSNSSIISKCYSSALVSATNYSVGGLIGDAESSTVTNCYATGNVYGKSNVGNFIGLSTSSTISNCYGTGAARQSNGDKRGNIGFAPGSTINDIFWDTETSGKSSGSYGTGKTTAEMKTQSTFSDAGWDFGSTWVRNDNKNGGYPYLSWQTFPNTITITNGSSFNAVVNTQTDLPIGRFALKSDASGSLLNGIWVKLNGNRGTGISNFKLWESNDSNFDVNSDTQIDSTVEDDPGEGNYIWFTGLYKILETTNKYYFITCDVASNFNGNIQASLTDNKELMFGLSALGSTLDNSLLSSSVLKFRSAPTTQASNITFSSIQNTQATISWTNGNGDSRAVFIKQTNTGTASPENDDTYTASTLFGNGSQIGSTGWYCVYNGTGTSETVTNLTAGKEYSVMVAEYIGSSGIEAYNTNSESNNPINFTAIPTHTATSPTVGDGSIGNPYEIASLANLHWIASNSDRWSLNYTQTANIDASTTSSWDDGNGGTAEGWSPIGNNLIGFSGSYNGNGLRIEGVYLTRNVPSIGFFGQTDGATITNLNLVDAVVKNDTTSNNRRTGALIGNATNTTIISYCSSINGTIIGDSYVGGLVGDNNGSSINNCFSTGNVYCDSFFGGGLVGRSFNGSISNSYNKTNVTRTNGNNAGIAAFIGNNYSSTVTNCYSTGSFTNTSTNGDTESDRGFIGNTSDGSGNFVNNFFDTQTSNGQTTGTGATGKTTAEMKTQSTFTSAGWDFVVETTNGSNDYWKLDGTNNSGYPYLSWQVYAPLTQASNITLSNITNTSVTIGWANGDGSSRALFIKQANTGSASPADYTTYTANTAFTSGTQIGSTGWYCIYNGTGTNVTVTNFTANTEYRIMVTEYNGSTGSEVYNTNSATNNPKNFTTKLATATLSSPSDNATGVSLSPTLSWSSVSGADKYKLEVNTASDFSGTVIYDQDTVSLANKQIGGLSDNKQYYWRVTALTNGGNTSDVSSVYNFTTGQTSLTSPSNNALSVSLTPTFSWPATTGASSYHLEVNTNNSFSGTTILDTTTSATSKILNGTSLAYNTTYYWRVTATSSGLGKTNTSSVYSFTTKLATATLSSPSNNATGVSLTPTLSWSSVSGADKYRLEVNTASGFDGTTIYDQDTVGFNTKQIGGLTDSTKYYWRITALTSSGNYSDFSTVRNFTTVSSVTNPTMIVPESGSTGVPTDPTLSWPVTDGANIFRLEVNTDVNFGAGTIFLDTTGVTSDSLTLTGLAPNTTYYWRVTAFSNELGKVTSTRNNWEITSSNKSLTKTTNTAIFSFTTGASPLPVELAGFGAKFIGDVVTLKWSTATEINNYGFEVQRRIPAQVRNDNPGWEKIGFVPGAGNSNAPKNYSFTDKPTGGTSFSYRLKQIDNDGKYKIYDAITVSLSVLAKAELMQNSPNPFNPSTKIKFYIPEISNVTIKIYDILGKEVNTLINDRTDAGYHIVYWNGKDKYGESAASGVYFYRLSTNVGFVQTKKMMLLK